MRDFYNTQSQFAYTHSEHTLSPLHRTPSNHRQAADPFEPRRGEKENKYLNQKRVIDAQFKDDDMALVNKYAARFGLNPEQSNF